jgi:hypothetical protein
MLAALRKVRSCTPRQWGVLDVMGKGDKSVAPSLMLAQALDDELASLRTQFDSRLDGMASGVRQVVEQLEVHEQVWRSKSAWARCLCSQSWRSMDGAVINLYSRAVLQLQDRLTRLTTAVEEQLATQVRNQ